MSANCIRVLMTGAGAPGAPGIIKCLQKADWIRLTVADANENAVGKYLHTDFVLIPNAGDPLFKDQLLQICLDKKIDMILPLVTRELLQLAQEKQRFEQHGVRILVSSPDAIQVANNKAESYSFLQAKGIDVPAFFIVSTVEQFIHAAFELGHPGQSFCFKPSVSNGSRGVRIVSDSLDESEQLFNEKPYNLFITYAHALKILLSKSFPQLLVSEYLPGPEYSVDCLADHGKVKLVLPRSRQRMINGISVQGKFEQHRAIMDYCTQIIEAIGLHGNIGLQVKLTATGKPLLLEINPRVQGTIVAALGAGVNLPLLAIKQELKIPIAAEETNIRWDTNFIRYWTEVYF